MSQAEMDSTRKVTTGSVEKSLVVTIIKLLWNLHCLKVINVVAIVVVFIDGEGEEEPPY